MIFRAVYDQNNLLLCQKGISYDVEKTFKSNIQSLLFI